MLSFVLLVNRSGTMVLPFIVIFLRSEQGFTPSEAGLLLSVYGVGSIAGAFLGGWLASHWGAVRTQIISLSLSAPLFVSLAYVQGWWALAFNLLVLSVIAELVRPASATATAEFCPRSLHKKAYALNRLAVNLGMTLGPAIGGFVYLFDFRWLFYLDAASCFVAMLMLLGFFGFPKHRPIAEERCETDQFHGKPWQDVSFLMFLGLMVSVAVVFFQLMSTYPLFLKEEYGFIESEIGLLLAINTIVIVVVEMLLIHLLRGIQDLKIVAWGAVCVCIGFGLTPFGRGAAFCIFTILIWTVGEMLLMPLSLAFVSRRASSGNRGLYLGLYTMSYSIAFVISPFIGTNLYERSPNYPWYAALLVTVPLFAGFMWLAKREPDRKSSFDEVLSEQERDASQEAASGDPRRSDSLRDDPLSRDAEVAVVSRGGDHQLANPSDSSIRTTT